MSRVSELQITAAVSGPQAEILTKEALDFVARLTTEFEARLRIDTPKELDYYQHGGILQYVLRQLAATTKAA